MTTDVASAVVRIVCLDGRGGLSLCRFDLADVWRLDSATVHFFIERSQFKCLAGRFVIPIGNKDLRFFVRCSVRRPSQFFAIWCKDRQAIKSIRGRDPHRRMCSLGIHQIQLEVRKAMHVGTENQIVATWMKIGSPTHRAERRQAFDVGAIEIGRVDFRRCTVL